MKFTIIGFSVTEESNGYVTELIKNFSSNESVDINHRAIGGVTFKLLPYILPQILDMDPESNHIIFEIASCNRFEESVDDYIAHLEDIGEICRSRGMSYSFVNLFRVNVDYPSDLLIPAILKFSKSNNIKVLDTYKKINEDNATYYLRDGIHTNPNGAVFYAAEIQRFINSELLAYSDFEKKNLPNLSSLMRLKSSKRFVPFSELEIGASFETGYFGRGNLKFEYAVLTENISYEISFDRPVVIKGVLYMLSPKTGMCKLSFPESNINILMYDEHCFYNRFCNRLFPDQYAQKIVLLQSPQIPEVELKKGEKDLSTREANILGFLVEG